MSVPICTDCGVPIHDRPVMISDIGGDLVPICTDCAEAAENDEDPR